MRKLGGIKPQDILLLLKMISSPNLKQKELAQAIFISQTEVSHGLKRLEHTGLIGSSGQIQLEAVCEFLIHGMKYIFPAETGAMTVGLPTAYANPKFKFVKYKIEDIYVWPHPKLGKKGIALLPIYPSVAEACAKDELLYEMMSLLEMIRIGRAREKNIAAKELKIVLEKAL